MLLGDIVSALKDSVNRTFKRVLHESLNLLSKYQPRGATLPNAAHAQCGLPGQRLHLQLQRHGLRLCVKQALVNQPPTTREINVNENGRFNLSGFSFEIPLNVYFLPRNI